MRRIPRTNALLRLFINHPNAANLLMVGMLMMGAFALMRMNIQFFPSVDIPRVTVSIAWPGASAEDVEKNILDALEPELRFIDGLDEITSTAREGAAVLGLEFFTNANMQKAVSDVEAAVSGVTTLPADSERPVIRQIVFYENVANIVLSGPFSEIALKRYAKLLRDGLLAAGIDRVTFEGFRDEEIWVMVPPRTLRRLDLTVSDIAARIGQSNRDIPSGILEGSFDRQIRSLGLIETATGLGGIEIRALANGEKIRLRDIARIEERFERSAPVGFQGDKRAIKLVVQRVASADTLQVARLLKETLAEIVPTLPATLKVERYNIRADLVSARINLLLKNGAGGLVLVLIILFIFLNSRIALWVAVGIPVAVLATLGVMWATGQSINMVSLFALILTLGIIVDDAIVVGEHTATLHGRGLSAVEAAERGAARMFMPVIAATLTTQAAFLPIFMIGGVIGDIMSALPLVVVAVLVASLIECFLVLPGHLRHALEKQRNEASRFRVAFNRGFDRLRDNAFRRFATTCYEWRYTTLTVALAALVVAFGLVAGGRVGFKFFPAPEPEIVNADVVFAAGTPFEEEDAALRQMIAALERAEDELSNGKGGLVVTSFTVRGRSGRARDDNVARIEVQLRKSEERTVRTAAIIKAWRRALPQLPGVERVAIAGHRAGPPGRDIHVELTGAAPAVLKAAALELRQVLARFPGVSAVADDQPYGKEELILELTPKGRALGFTTQIVGQQVRNAFEGAIAKKFARGDEEVTIRVKADHPARGIGALRDLYLRAPAGDEVPLLEIVSLRTKAGFSVIQRKSGKATVSVTAEVDQAVTDNQLIVGELAAGAMLRLARKFGIQYRFKGRAEETAETFGDLRTGAIGALVMIYIILAWVFGRYGRPLIIMLIIPFGLVGAIAGHMLMGFPLTILSFFGLLGLAGILVNDSIILVNQVERRLEAGETLQQAAVGGAQDRLRAVLLTSLTTIGGLTPLLFEKSLQAQFLMPMAITLVFGLAVATLLVLILVPAALGVADDLARLLRRAGELLGLRRPPARA